MWRRCYLLAPCALLAAQISDNPFCPAAFRGYFVPIQEDDSVRKYLVPRRARFEL